MASPVIADPFHRMKYMERHGSGLRKIVRETEKPPGYTAAYNPKIFSTATDFRVILKNVNYQLSQKNLVNDQVSEQDKSPDIPHTVLNLCIHLIAHPRSGYLSLCCFLRTAADVFRSDSADLHGGRLLNRLFCGRRRFAAGNLYGK